MLVPGLHGRPQHRARAAGGGRRGRPAAGAVRSGAGVDAEAGGSQRSERRGEAHTRAGTGERAVDARVGAWFWVSGFGKEGITGRAS